MKKILFIALALILATPTFVSATETESTVMSASQREYVGTVTSALKPNRSGNGGIVKQRLSWRVECDENSTYWVNIDGNWHQAQSVNYKHGNTTYYWYAAGYYFNF